ncbi:MAG: IS4 family transposase [Terrimonas sp.]|nr:IS4 family transposase [Terrimonas sp.]
MTAKELIGLIPEDIFEELSAETKVDAQVKKLSGEVIFKLILFSMLNSSKPSLRVMEAYLQSAQFKSFTGYDILDGKYNSIRDRICTVNADYFAKLFEKIFLIYNKELKEEKALSKTDSTYVALAAKLFSIGMENGTNDKRFVKYSVNLKGSIPSSVKVFTAQSYVSEELALTEVINDTDCIKNDVVVFDRGLQSRNSFDKFTNSQKWFVSRANPNIRCKTVTQIKVGAKSESSTVTIISDETGYLINKKEKATAHVYRVIKAVINKSGELICFVTNIIDEDAYMIAAWYRQRWEIEVFFKFIKQHLNVNHLVSRNINGIKVMIYMTMILAILIIAYKKINRIKGFKIAKLKFELELETEIMRAVVILCGGNPDNAPHLFSSA